MQQKGQPEAEPAPSLELKGTPKDTKCKART